jgi:polyisoprenoid-binding protein YceI
MKLNVSRFFSLSLLTLISFLAYAKVPEWQIILERSSLSFTAVQNGAPVTGEFKTFSGNIAFDVNDLKNSAATIVVNISSVSASYADLTATLLTPDWFNAKLFPNAEFKSTEFSKTDENTYQAKGTLTIRDKTQPVILTFTANEAPKGVMNVDGSTSIKRSAFGVGQGEWSSTKEVQDDVKVNFKLVAKVN